MTYQITSLTIVYSTIYLENIKTPRHWALWVEFTGDRCIPVTWKMLPFDDVTMVCRSIWRLCRHKKNWKLNCLTLFMVAEEIKPLNAIHIMWPSILWKDIIFHLWIIVCTIVSGHTKSSTLSISSWLRGETTQCFDWSHRKQTMQVHPSWKVIYNIY